MYNRIELLHLRPDQAADETEKLLFGLRQDRADGVESMLEPTLPGVYNGGDYLRRQRASSQRACAAVLSVLPDQRLVARVDSAGYEDGDSGGDWSGHGIYRVLLLSLRPAAPAAAVARFEREVPAMPRYIDAIRAWRFSRVTQAAGARPWTHVWEQRYDTLQGLTSAYMMHPYHWAWIDRWFDPESPDWIVDTHLCHSFCSIS